MHDILQKISSVYGKIKKEFFSYIGITPSCDIGITRSLEVMNGRELTDVMNGN